MRDVVRRNTEVSEVVEGTTKVKNERRGEERHRGGTGCGRNRQDIAEEDDPSGHSQWGINGRKKIAMMMTSLEVCVLTPDKAIRPQSPVVVGSMSIMQTQ